MDELLVSVEASDVLVRAGLVALIGGADGLVLAEPDDAQVVVRDVPEGAALADAWALDPPIVALVASAADARDALAAGARAVLRRDGDLGRLAAAARAAEAGLVVLDDELVDELVRGRPDSDTPEPLTPREREVLDALAGGLSNREIGERLDISAHTVKFHVASLLEKLDATTRTEAVVNAARWGVLVL